MASAPGSDCSEIRLLLSSLVDGEATPEDAARAAAHVASCDACASHLAFLRLTGIALRRTSEAYPPASLTARIAAATYERTTLAERVAAWLRPAPARVAIGMATAGIASVLLVSRIGTGPITTVATLPSGGASAPRVASALPSHPAAPSPGTVSPALRSPSAVPIKPATAPVVAVRPSTAVVLPPAHGVTAPPVTVATNVKPRNIEATMGQSGQLPSPEEALHAIRSQPLPDRSNRGVRGIKSAASALQKSRGSVPNLARSGYDRAAETMLAMHQTEVPAMPSPSVAAAPAGRDTPPQPRTIATPTVVAEAMTAKSSGDSDASAGSGSPAPSAAAAVAAPQPPANNGMIRIPLLHHRSFSSSIDTAYLKNQASVGPTGAGYDLDHPGSAKTSVVSAKGSMD